MSAAAVDKITKTHIHISFVHLSSDRLIFSRKMISLSFVSFFQSISGVESKKQWWRVYRPEKKKSGASGDVLPFYSSLRFCSISFFHKKRNTHNVVVVGRRVTPFFGRLMLYDMWSLYMCLKERKKGDELKMDSLECSDNIFRARERTKSYSGVMNKSRFWQLCLYRTCLDLDTNSNFSPAFLVIGQLFVLFAPDAHVHHNQ